MPRSVNRNHFRFEEGVGPPPKRKPRKGQNLLPQPWQYVGRGSPLGNQYRPHSAGNDGEALSREGALELYRRWLWQKIRSNDPRVMLAMRSISADTALVCSCAPKTCHADIVVRAWEWLRTQGLV
jgi:hypothetical protein